MSIATKTLTIPQLPADVSTLDAALIYADAGWYVGPARRGTKNPGSLLGTDWQLKTMRDSKLIAATFAGADHGLFLHAGRSGAIMIDVDHEEYLPDVIVRAEQECRPPTQQTRPGRWHLVFAQPPGRDIGNSTGKLGAAWGEVRGRHGVIMVYPSEHPDGGEYRWLSSGVVPLLPSYVAELLPDQQDSEDAADDEQVRRFLAEHVDETRPDLFDVLMSTVKEQLPRSARHDLFVSWTATAMKEAACGYYPARLAADTLEAIFHDAEGKGPGRVRARAEAASEFAALLAWGVAQTTAVNLAETRERIAKRDAERQPLTTTEGEPVSTSATTADATSSNGKEPSGQTTAAEKREAALSLKMQRHIEARFDIFAGDDGYCYALPLSGDVRVAERVTSGFVIRACARIGHSSKAARECADVLVALADGRPRRKLWLRAARTKDSVVLDLAQQDSSRCVVVTGGGWQLRDYPPAGVVFRRSRVTQALPDPEHSGDLDVLRRLLGFDVDDRRWLLINGWLPASLLPDVARPMLAFVGPQGSAKTTRASMVVSVLDPKPHEGLGSSFGRQTRDDEVTALAHYLPAWDNISTLSADRSDFLARLVTGTSSGSRKLYSDDMLSVITYRRTAVLTGITLPPKLGSDVMERLIVIACDRLADDQRRSEDSLWDVWDMLHARVLGGTLDQLVGLLSRLNSAKARRGARPRMADYFDALTALDGDVTQAYLDATTDVMIDSAEADPFVSVIVSWLDARRDPAWQGTPAEAYAQAMSHLAHGYLGDRSAVELPRGAQPFSSRLTRASESLRALGIEYATRRSNGARLMSLDSTQRRGSDTGVA